MLGIEPRRAFFIEVELLSRQVGEQRSRGAFKGRTGYVSGTSVDRFLLWMYQLHSGQAFGLLGRILVCITEAVVAVLAWTGVALWLRKQRAVEQCEPSGE